MNLEELGQVCKLTPEELVDEASRLDVASKNELTDNQAFSVIKNSINGYQTKLDAQLKDSIDYLTGFPGRNMFEGQIAQHHARFKRDPQKNSYGVLEYDLDHLKSVNDLLGHDAGDDYLRAFACAAREGVRDGDQWFRIGGDEFAAIIFDVNDDITLQLVEERVKEKTIEQFNLLIANWSDRTNKKTDKTLSNMGLDVSSGRALPNQDNDVLTIIKKADEMLYEMKESKGNKPISVIDIPVAFNEKVAGKFTLFYHPPKR